MKILWHGVPGEYNTGYGTQTKLFAPALKRAGHEVVISSVVNSCFNYTDQNDLPVVVNGSGSRMGNAMIKEHVVHMKPDVLLSMFDTFVCDPEQYKDAPWVAWCVVDSAPLHPKIKRISSTPKVLWAMSRFGQRTLAEAGFKSDYVPLAIDPEEYNPEDKAGARKTLSKIWGRPVPKFLAVMVSANMSNPSRKNFFGAFEAWRMFTERHKDALFYCHTEHTGAMASGENLVQLADMCGMNPEILMFPDQYRYNQGRFGTDYMRTLYSAADVLLCTSLGEGFCLPLIEAQACGCPVIAPKATSTAELIEATTGQAIDMLTPLAFHGPSEWAMPDAGQATCKLERYYAAPVSDGRRRYLSQTIHEQYGIDNVMVKFLLPALHKAIKNIENYKARKGKKS